MSALSSHRNFVTVAEYLRDEERSSVKHQYLNGIVHAMAGGTLGHDAMGLNVTSAMKTRLRGHRSRPLGSDALVHLSRQNDERYYYPDASVTCGPFDPAARAIVEPLVIFEALSPSTARIDRTERRRRISPVPASSTTSSSSPSARKCRSSRAGRRGWAVTIYFELSDSPPLPAIETELPLAEIYEG